MKVMAVHPLLDVAISVPEFAATPRFYGIWRDHY
jgi:hypothetical protein